MYKKVVVLGGGTGMSTLLRGLKNFPLDIIAIVSVCDDGKSTGRLRKEFNIPAVGDIRKVIASLAETEPLVEKLINYRFQNGDGLSGHTIGNLLLTALTNITGNVSEGVEALGKVLNLKGKVIPLTEDNVTLMAHMEDGDIVEGERNITLDKRKIKDVFYKEKPIVNKDAIKAIKEADLIVLSMGSIYTSIIPNLICKEITDAIDSNKNSVMYVSNIVTQPGETDNFKVSDHIRVINNQLGKKKIDVVVANNSKIDKQLALKYSTLEQKDPVLLDYDKLKQENIKIIEDDLVVIEDNMLRHDVMKLAFNIFSYLI